MTRHRWSFFTAFAGLAFAAFVFWVFNALNCAPQPAYGHGAPFRGPTFRRAPQVSLPIPSDAVVFFVGGWESNWAGTNGAPPVTTTASNRSPLTPDFKACQDRVDFSPPPRVEALRETYGGSGCWSAAERPGSGFVQAFRDRYPSHVPSFVAIECGQAGVQRDRDLFSAPSTPQLYTTLCLQRIQEHYDLVQASPGTYGSVSGQVIVVAVGDMQGENDQSVAQADYYDDLVAHQAYLNAQIRLITGQSADPFWILETPSAWASLGGETAPTGAALAKAARCAEDPRTICFGPSYAHEGETSSPYLHKEPENHRWAGELAGAAAYHAVFGGTWSAPVVADAIATGLSIDIVFDQDVEIAVGVDTPALGTGTAGGTVNYGCPAHPGGAFGLEVLEDATVPTLSGCTQTGARTINCALSAPVNEGENPFLAVAWSSTAPSNAYGCQGSTANSFSNIRSPTSLIYAEHARVPITVQYTAYAGVIASLSQSYGDPASVYSAPDASAIYTSVEVCSTPPTGETTCAFWSQPGNTTGEPAAEPVSDPASTFVVPATQVLSRMLEDNGENPLVVIVHQAFPGIRTSFHTETQAVADLDAVAAYLATRGVAVYPLLFNDNGGGYQHQDLGDPFSTWSAAIEVQRAAFASHFAAQVAAGAPGYCTTCATGPTEVAYNDGSLHAAGGTDNVWEVHPYSDEVTQPGFWNYEDDDHSSCANFAFVPLGVDGIHPEHPGTEEIADQLARCWFRVIVDGRARSLRATGVTALSPTQLRVTYDVPCRHGGALGCLDDPPITAPALATTTQGDIVTGGVHFMIGGTSGTLLTPPALSTWTADACAPPAASCTAVLTFASALPDFDVVRFCDVAEGPNGLGAGVGGCDIVSRTDEGASLNDSTNARDQQQSSVLVVSSFDGGVDGGPADASDGGTPDSGYDGGTPDSGYDGGTPDSGFDGGAVDAGTLSTFQNLSATNLDDSDDYYTLTGGMTALDSVSAFTLCFWDRETTRGVNEYLFGEYTTAQQKLAMFSRGANYYFYLAATVATAARAETTSNVYANDVFQHTCIVFDGTQTGDANRLLWYVTSHAAPCAGACQETLTFTGVSVPATTTAPTMGDFWIGAGTSAAQSWGSATSYFDDFNIWAGTALSATQIDIVMGGATLDHSVAQGSVPAADHCYRFETGGALTDSCGATDLSSATGSPTLVTVPQVRTTPNRQTYDPSANSDYLSLTTFGGAATAFCYAGWFEVGNQFDAVLNQWGAGGASTERFWNGHNPSGVHIAAFGDGTANGGRQWNLANTDTGATTIVAGTGYFLAACFDGANTDVETWMNGVRARGGTQDSGSGLVSLLAADRQLDIGQNTHARDADEVVLMTGRVWTDAEVCGMYCATRLDTDAVSVTGNNGAPDCDCDAVNIDASVFDLSGFVDQRWYKLDGDLTDEFGGTSLTDQDTADYSDN